MVSGGRPVASSAANAHLVDVCELDAVLLRRPQRALRRIELALLGRQFPGSWLPDGQEQIIRSAEPHFRLLSSMSGRLDYIETIGQWNRPIGAPSLRKDAVQAPASPALAHQL